MTDQDFRRIALALDGAVEGAHMGHPDFRAHGRIFATLKTDRRSGMVKLTPGQQRQFMRASAAFTPESGAWGRGGCTSVSLTSVDSETLGEALTLAWRNVLQAKPAARRPPKAPAAGRKAVRR